MRIIIVLDLICKLYTHIVVRNPRPQSDSNWDNRRGWLWCEDHVCSRSVNALLRCFIKRSTLITSSFPWGPAANGLVGQKMLCKFSLRARTTIYGTHAYGYLVLGCFILFICNAYDLIIIWTILSMQRPFIRPYAYSILILLFTSITTAVFISFLLLFHYCCCYKTVTTDKPLRTSPLSGAGELTTHLLRLTNILWLPLCRINKFGFYFPRRLLRSPILVGHHPRTSPESTSKPLIAGDHAETLARRWASLSFFSTVGSRSCDPDRFT